MSTSSPLTALSDSEQSTLSSPLSNLSKTPSLPSSPDMPVDPAKRYPSPTSTTVSGIQSPVKLGEPIFDHEIVNKALDDSADGPPPAKKRRISPRKSAPPMTALRKKKKIVVIAGAGISVSAGIPDFRSATGLFATAKSQHKLAGSGKHLFDASVYKHDATTRSFHKMEGRLLRLYSQNIDCIDTSMKPLATNIPLNPKGPWPATIQLHGSLEKMVCTKCGQLQPFDGSVFDGAEAPLCGACVVDDQVRTAHAGKRSHGIGRLRPRFVLYNEFNPDEEAIGNVSSADLKARPDAVLVVGTTLKIPGTRRLVKEMCQVARGRRDGITAWINLDSEPKGVDLKNCWDIVEEHRESQERRSKTTFAVNIPVNRDIETELSGKPKQFEQVQGIPTPNASPKISAAKKPAKTKQSKISFTGKASTNDKPNKVTKSRGRKPGRRPLPADPPKKSAMQSFKAVKNVAAQAKTTKTGPNGPSKRDVPVKEMPDATTLPPLRPARRVSQENFLYKHESSERADDSSSGPPSSPTMAPSRRAPDTISPKSVPASLRRLID
ncbi:hypothetical protein MRS44_000765 [Fusarium solani]|uniref:uncharacterized protein n=1 Tax=Fusarium solani TaxID=169388 RepID=UPI0032C462BB|nr:hypothetical protein MRS44_000765 [Fusarium solani]